MKKSKNIIAIMLSTVLFASLSVTAYSETASNLTTASDWSSWSQGWEKTKTDYTKLSLTPGTDATQLNFAWYTANNNSETPKVKIAKKSEMKGNEFPSNAKEFTGNFKDAIAGYISNKVTVIGLLEKTEYMYSYGKGDTWSNPEKYTSQSTDEFKIIFVGDPQIGASGDQAKDAYNWDQNLNKIYSNNSNASFIISAGDQINTEDAAGGKLSSKNEEEYSGYLYASVLKSLPIANTIGNHDQQNANYTFHFNNPNASSYGQTGAGGDYYYSYGDALFIVLNSNNESMQEHDKLIKEATSKYPNAKWKIATIHHDIYGAGKNHSQSDAKDKRQKFASIFEANGIDAVLQGHDHSYSRSFPVSDTKGNDNYKVTDISNTGVSIDPKGIVYITGSSSTGSKLYDLTSPKPDYIATDWQGGLATYSTIEIDSNSFKINTFKIDNNEKIDSYTIEKSKGTITPVATSTTTDTKTPVTTSTATATTSTATTSTATTKDNEDMLKLLGVTTLFFAIMVIAILRKHNKYIGNL